MMTIILGVIGGLILLGILIALNWYKVVEPSEVHVVVKPSGTIVYSSDLALQKTKGQTAGEVEGSKGKIVRPDNEYLGGRWYFNIPFLYNVRKLDMTIKELVSNMETYEKDQGRYSVKYSIKYRIKNPLRASETYDDDKDLQKQLDEVVQAGVRAITVKYAVTEARANKRLMSEEIEKEIEDDLERWGLELVNFVLVDFQDTNESKIISNISKQREKSIESETRQVTAQRDKEARTKEATYDEEAKKREIERDQKVAIYNEDKNKAVFEKQKAVKEADLEVQKVNETRSAEIIKERSIIEANQKKEVADITKEELRLSGEGEKLKAIEIAKGDAEKIRQEGLAQAEAKEKLQEALNKFEPSAIQALIAESVVAMQKEVGIEGAKALSNAELKVFAGGSDSSGFDLGQLVESIGVANPGAAKAVLNRLGVPNDLGFNGVEHIMNNSSNKENQSNNKSKKQKTAKPKTKSEKKLEQ